MSSGASTPRSALTPPPPTEGPSPMKVGQRFVKEYYKTLSTQPQLMSKFYQPTSTLSMASGADPAQPTAYENSVAQHNAQSRFLVLPNTENSAAGKDGHVLPTEKDYKIRFELENGAIDAQASVNGGVLLVVTGQIVYYHEDEDDDAENNNNQTTMNEHYKAFVHTFFLGSLVSGTMRSFYIHNEVLRFLHEETTSTTTVVEDTATTAAAAAAVPVVEPTAVTSPNPANVVEDTSEPTAEPSTEPEVVSPGGGVEESKQEVIVEEEEEEVVEKEPVATKETEGTRSPKDSVVDKQATPAPAPSKPVKPNSWASLVATTPSNKNGSSSTPGTPSRPSAATKVAASPAKPTKSSEGKTHETNKTDKATTNQSNKNVRGGGNKRDPDFTLVIKNVDVSNTNEADVRGLFEPFAIQNNAKVVGCHVAGHKGLAFVDYNAAAPVLAAVKQQEKEAFVLKGKTLEVIQKSLDLQKPQQKGRNQGGGGGGRNSGRAYRRSGSGGGGGRNERSGGGGGRGGRTGR